jgi:hypothetical protein
VRCRPRARTSPASRQRASSRSKSSASCAPASSRAEFAQHRGVEACVVQLQAQGILPVDPRAHRVGGLVVGEVLGELQERDQRQLRRGEGRLAEHGEERREVLVGGEPAQLVVHPQVGLALGEGGPRGPRRLLRHHVDGLRLQRHGSFLPGAPPRARSRSTPPAYRTTPPAGADFANNICTG